jgi:hypothetical protein
MQSEFREALYFGELCPQNNNTTETSFGGGLDDGYERIPLTFSQIMTGVVFIVCHNIFEFIY